LGANATGNNSGAATGAGANATGNGSSGTGITLTAGWCCRQRLRDRMIKSELILRIAEQNPHLYNRDVETVVNAILDESKAALVRRDRVELRGFGALSVKIREARRRHNPKTRVVISVPETHLPVFRTGTEMKARLNGTPGSALRAAFHKLCPIKKALDLSHAA
jgi:integration host factor subunit beta